MLIKSPSLCQRPTYNNKVVAPVALAALIARPVLVPDVCTIHLHVATALRLALLLGHAALGDVVLLESALGEVGLAAPAYFSAADILKRFAGLDRVEALLCVARLVGADIALESLHEIHCKLSHMCHCVSFLIKVWLWTYLDCTDKPPPAAAQLFPRIS